MKRTSIWARAATAVLVAGMAFAIAWASPASAQSTLTPEGTVIKNIATVTYTDANNNTYNAAKDSVMVTVGFLAGIDVRATAASVNVSPGSADNQITFWVKNLSNGSTGVTFSLIDSTTVVATNISYYYNSIEYGSLAALQTAVGTIAQGDSVLVTIEYNAAAGSGGLIDNLRLGATTVKSTTGGTTATDSDATNIVSQISGGIAVSPDGTDVGRLPSNGTNYVATFTVTNNQTGGDTFTLADSVSTGQTAGLVLIKMYFCDDGTKTPITSVTLAAGASRDVCVEYSVANNAAGSTGTIYVTATSNTTGTVYDTGSYDVTIVRPALQVVKKAYLETVSGTDSTMSATEVGTNLVLPGQYIWYKIEVKNVGTFAASAVEITDQLPSQVTYVSRTDDGGAAPAWTYTGINTGTGLIKAQLTGIAAPVSPDTEVIRWIAVRVRVK